MSFFNGKGNIKLNKIQMQLEQKSSQNNGQVIIGYET